MFPGQRYSEIQQNSAHEKLHGLAIQTGIILGYGPASEIVSVHNQALVILFFMRSVECLKPGQWRLLSHCLYVALAEPTSDCLSQPVHFPSSGQKYWFWERRSNPLWTKRAELHTGMEAMLSNSVRDSSLQFQVVLSSFELYCHYTAWTALSW